MKHRATILAFGMALTALMLGACSDDSPIAPPRDAETPLAGNADKIAQIIGVQTATLHIYARNSNPGPVNVHRITAPWDEATTTFTTFGGQYDPEVRHAFPVDDIGWQTADVTGLVGDWIAGIATNHGLLLDQLEDGTPWIKYYSRESAGFEPFLEICFLTAEGIVCEVFPTIADTYIWEHNPDAARGGDPVLYTGMTPPSEYKKQSLLRFDIPEIPDEPGEGCTLTPGYWKTHSEYGPAPYDPTWALLPDGADTPFFLSSQTYHQALWTSPRGNAYYILAHAYIAAELNRLGGADLSEVQDTFDQATELFETYTPAQIGALRGGARGEIVALASILDDYNNGLIGPGHCDD